MVNPNHLSATVDKLVPFYYNIKSRRGPITLTVFPTTKCNLDCDFCSNYEDRKIGNDLPLEKILDTLKQFPSIQTVEISGGGDPTLYPAINTLIYILTEMSYRVGLITNGIQITNISPNHLKLLAWLRISVNGYIDFNHIVDWDYIYPNCNYVGITYIHHTKSITDWTTRLFQLRRLYPWLRYCKVCNDSYNEEHHTESDIYSDWFYHYDHAWDSGPHPPCYCGSVKPVLATNGCLYPCAALVLFDGKYDPKDAITIDQIRNYTEYNCLKPKCPAHDKNFLLQKYLFEKDEFWDFV